MPWVIFLLEFIILFATSRFLFKSIYVLLHTVFRSQKISIFILSLFFLPGVFVHEISHFLVAELLRVKTHGIEFVPELSGTDLKMGSVKVEQSDIIRSLLIGIAPLVVGSSLLVTALFILGKTYSYSQAFTSVGTFLISLLVVIVIFMVTNTMFSSGKDVEGLIEVLIIAAILFGALYFIGLSPHEAIIGLAMQAKVIGVIEKIDWLMGIPVAINLLVVTLSMPLLRGRGLRFA
jgi:hypothetical protein